MASGGTLQVEPGSIWRDDCGAKYLIDRVEGDWVFTKDPRSPKRSPAVNQTPLAWFGRPGWTQIREAV